MAIARNQKGFSPVIILLILLILAALGYAGWRVFSADDGKSGSPAASESSKPDSKAESSKPAPTYVMPPSEAYKLALPEGWVKKTCPDTEDLLFLAQSTDKLGTCNSENGGTVAVAKTSGNTGHPETYYTSDPQYGSVSYTSFTADSITGHKVSYTIAVANEMGYPPVGTQQTQYVLYDGTNTYQIVYTRNSGNPDLSATVQTLAESFDKL